jgi:hypothetical protein
MGSSIDTDNTTTKTEIADHWSPTVASLTRMDPNQQEPLMKLLISIRQDALQYHASVLIDSATTMNFVSKDFLTRNNLLGKRDRGQKIVVQIANEQRISTS